MRQVNLAEAKAHLSELVAHAAAGEPVCITRGGKPGRAAHRGQCPAQAIDPSALQAVTDAMLRQPESAREFVRRMRDDDRY